MSDSFPQSPHTSGRFHTGAFPRNCGFSLAYILAGLACLLALAVAAGSYLLPVIKNNHRQALITRSVQSVTQAAYLLAVAATDSDGDGVREAPAFLTGTFAPTGGGNVPATNNAPQYDAWGRLLGYCAWDNGTTTASANRIAGDNPGTTASISLGVLSAGPDGVFNTTCAGLKSGTVSGDDIARIFNVEQVKQAVNGTLSFGEPVADSTALAAVPTGSLLDGNLRLIKSDNSLWRWNAGSSAWQQVTLAVTPSPNHNYLINGNFDIWQRGTSFSSFTNNTYTADRWGADAWTTGNISVSRVAVTPSDTNAPQGANYALQLVPSASGTSWELYQPIENLRQFSNRTLTLSFYARNTLDNGSTNHTTLGVSLVGNFGTGGTPSSNLTINAGTAISLTATWTKYTVTLNVPDLSGYTFGSNHNGFLEFNIGLNTQSGVPNVQFAQVQVEGGSTATPFEFRPLGQEILLCQRYYLDHTGNAALSDINTVYVPNSSTYYRSWMFVAEMRTTPSIKLLSAVSGQSAVSSGPTQVAVSTEGVSFSWVTTSSGGGLLTLGANWAADAEF